METGWRPSETRSGATSWRTPPSERLQHFNQSLEGSGLDKIVNAVQFAAAKEQTAAPERA